MYFTKKARAIAVFNRLLKRFYQEPDNVQMTLSGMDYWLRSIADSIEKYIGVDSFLRQACINLITFNTLRMERFGSRDMDLNLNDTSFSPDQLLKECIEHIELNGVYQRKGNNFLGSLSNAELVPLLSTIFIALFGGAFSIGLSLNYFNQKSGVQDKQLITEVSQKLLEKSHIKKTAIDTVHLKKVVVAKKPDQH